MSKSDTLASELINVAFIKSIPVLRPLATQFYHEQAKEFDRLLACLRKKRIAAFVLDLQDCTNISSDGLGMIATWWERCEQKNNLTMSVVLPRHENNEVVNLFDITGLTRTIGGAMQQSVRNALHYLRTFAGR